MNRYPTVLYFVLTLLYVIGIQTGSYTFEYSRILLMPVLFLLLFFNWTGKKDVVFFAAVMALGFASAGDVLMTFSSQNDVFFRYAMFAFFAMNVAYIFVFYRTQHYTGATPNRLFIISRILILAFAGGAFLNVLWPKIQSFKMYIAAYAAAVLLMAVFAILRRERTSATSFSFIYGGALMLIVNSGMISVTKFLHSFAFQQELILVSYALGQFFIIKGVVAHHQFSHRK